VKSFIVACLFLIVGNLGCALRYLFVDSVENSDRLVKALTWRVVLSLALFFVLLVGHYFGWISGHPLNRSA
jgi:hypothetical protein